MTNLDIGYIDLIFGYRKRHSLSNMLSQHVLAFIFLWNSRITTQLAQSGMESNDSS